MDEDACLLMTSTLFLNGTAPSWMQVTTMPPCPSTSPLLGLCQV
ncbi:Hypothetical protein, putative [Bodo saltans]|uniref:Uncharacterized protein n=1 Tax=Bodo saltans TaxID=75058 RepID=A0A0S4J712_BODSA|nr:Hypothetical protein, putative [Bodo saltans]|eukprot:CUG87263.1 Hypothetical protein, putative [Bodo saltans]